MRRLFHILALLALLPAIALAQSPQGLPLLGAGHSGPVAGGGGGGLAIVNLTSGTGTSNPQSTASINPTSGSLTLLGVCFAMVGPESGGVDSTLTPTGARGTWTQIAELSPSTWRRKIVLYAGTGTVTSEAISLTVNINDTETFQEIMWGVDEVTGQDTGTPYDAAVSTSTTATSIASPDVGTPNTGDMIYAVLMHDVAENITPGSEFTETYGQEGGANCRTVHGFYDLTATLDETPDASWSTTAGAMIIGDIINVAP